MAAKTSFVRFLLLAMLMAGAGNAMAQDELRRTFFRDADAAKQLWAHTETLLASL